MTPVALVVNGTQCTEAVEPRTQLADLLREKLNLTGTHLRCEQGACGACTLLIDGQPARSCITYAVLCQGAAVTTIEGLEDDPMVVALRRAFHAAHALQCGFCTPGMLVTARDIVLRLPEADERRIRLELSGNLCRCTGYVGIVRAIRRVLEERRRGDLAVSPLERGALGPVGSQHAGAIAGTAALTAAAPIEQPMSPSPADIGLGLGGKKPTIEIHQSFVIARPPAEVWAFLADVERMVPCFPGATLDGVEGDRLQGRLSIRLGPMTAAFNGEARVIRDDVRQCGTVLGAGRDRLSASRAAAEIEYALVAEPGGTATRVDVSVRTLLSGPLAQFGRSTIVHDLAARLTETFARNLERLLTGSTDARLAPTSLAAGSLLGVVVWAHARNAFARLLRLFGRR
jgi:aerobic carbon-monoxide dehydrogenase small subunit